MATGFISSDVLPDFVISSLASWLDFCWAWPLFWSSSIFWTCLSSTEKLRPSVLFSGAREADETGRLLCRPGLFGVVGGAGIRLLLERSATLWRGDTGVRKARTGLGIRLSILLVFCVDVGVWLFTGTKGRRTDGNLDCDGRGWEGGVGFLSSDMFKYLWFWLNFLNDLSKLKALKYSFSTCAQWQHC